MKKIKKRLDDAGVLPATSGEVMQSPVLDPLRDALFLDLDGTLIDIVADPGAVVAPASLVHVLELLARRWDNAIAIISGRPITAVDLILAPLRLSAVGVHGAEIRIHRDADIVRSGRAINAPLASRIAALAEVPGVLIEDKGVAIAVHYRQVPPDRLGELRRRVQRAIRDEPSSDVALLEGKRVFEIKPAAMNKGTGLAELMRHPPFTGRRPIFLGDDVTDEYAFARLPEWGGLGIAVGVLRKGAEFALPDAAAVRQWLHSMVDGRSVAR